MCSRSMGQEEEHLEHFQIWQMKTTMTPEVTTLQGEGRAPLFLEKLQEQDRGRDSTCILTICSSKASFIHFLLLRVCLPLCQLILVLKA